MLYALPALTVPAEAGIFSNETTISLSMKILLLNVKLILKFPDEVCHLCIKEEIIPLEMFRG